MHKILSLRVALHTKNQLRLGWVPLLKRRGPGQRNAPEVRSTWAAGPCYMQVRTIFVRLTTWDEFNIHE